jgi:hypothetical protein
MTSAWIDGTSNQSSRCRQYRLGAHASLAPRAPSVGNNHLPVTPSGHARPIAVGTPVCMSITNHARIYLVLKYKGELLPADGNGGGGQAGSASGRGSDNTKPTIPIQRDPLGMDISRRPA